MSPAEPSPHATGYEDAITRRIAGLETRIAELEADVVRERAQATGLAEDNAKLRGRTAEAEATLAAARRMRTLAWALLVVALLIVGAAAALRFGPARV